MGTAPPATGLRSAVLSRRIERLEGELRAARVLVAAAEQRAQLAQRSAEEAWQFAKTLHRCDRRDGTS